MARDTALMIAGVAGSGAADGGTSAYFVPRQSGGPAPVAPVAPAARSFTGYGSTRNDYDDATWALLYPTNNRFGIR